MSERWAVILLTYLLAFGGILGVSLVCEAWLRTDARMAVGIIAGLVFGITAVVVSARVDKATRP